MWVTQNWIPAAALLGAIAVVLFFTWSSTGRGLHLVLGFLALAMIGGVYAIDAAVETDEEHVERRTRELTDAFQRRDANAVLSYFAKDALLLRGVVATMLGQVVVDDDLRITDVAAEVDGDTAQIHFRANATVAVAGQGSFGYRPSRWRLTWEREDGEWRCSAAQRLSVVGGEELGFLEHRE